MRTLKEIESAKKEKELCETVYKTAQALAKKLKEDIAHKLFVREHLAKLRSEVENGIASQKDKYLIYKGPATEYVYSNYKDECARKTLSVNRGIEKVLKLLSKEMGEAGHVGYEFKFQEARWHTHGYLAHEDDTGLTYEEQFNSAYVYLIKKGMG
ncbi:MAG: hypothetical protein Q7S34_00685 [bacterium]|nr:hypothetical protein [bacterium]